MNENTLPDNYWIKLLANEKLFNELRLFKYNDISLKARTKEEIVELVKERFGSGTKNFKTQNSSNRLLRSMSEFEQISKRKQQLK